MLIISSVRSVRSEKQALTLYNFSSDLMYAWLENKISSGIFTPLHSISTGSVILLALMRLICSSCLRCALYVLCCLKQVPGSQDWWLLSWKIQEWMQRMYLFTTWWIPWMKGRLSRWSVWKSYKDCSRCISSLRGNLIWRCSRRW